MELEHASDKTNIFVDLHVKINLVMLGVLLWVNKQKKVTLS